MKKILLVFLLSVITGITFAQRYPEPEFSNEIYYLKKDSSYSVVRLEKGSSKMETKTKLGGFGGTENGYSIDGDKSSVRISNGNNLSFVFSTGAADGSSGSSSRSDSVMRANGIDPSMMQGMGGMMDPANTISLYKAESGKGERRILMQKIGGAMPFSNHKMQSSDKYTLSMKKIRNGYWELVVDKPLPKGEYAFTMMGMGTGSMNGEVSLFAFGVE